jgi:hypothetical protein
MLLLPKVGILADYLDEAAALNLTGEEAGDYVAKRLSEVGMTYEVLPA